MRFRPSVLGFGAALLFGGAVQAATILPGTYQLHNHSDGLIDPPPYGLRLDELVDVTGGHDAFSFDFEHPSSDMKLVYDDINGTITIFGQTYGGRDIGAGYAADIYQGVYQVSFVYDMNVAPVPGDDDIWVTAPPDNLNSGTITLPGGAPIQLLSDVQQGGYTFRFGDEDNDLGHRGEPGISGWGWLDINGSHVDYQDWLFTATYIPEPATGMLLIAGAAGMLIRRRRSAR